MPFAAFSRHLLQHVWPCVHAHATVESLSSMGAEQQQQKQTGAEEQEEQEEQEEEKSLSSASALPSVLLPVPVTTVFVFASASAPAPASVCLLLLVLAPESLSLSVLACLCECVLLFVTEPPSASASTYRTGGGGTCERRGRLVMASLRTGCVSNSSIVGRFAGSLSIILYMTSFSPSEISTLSIGVYLPITTFRTMAALFGASNGSFLVTT